MRSFDAILAVAVISIFLIGPDISAAAMSKTSDAKLYRLELEIEQTHPVVGNNAVLLTVTDARSNLKIDDAVVEVSPWMTMHGHGSSKKPTVKKQGGGKYRVENVFFTMEGDWDLIVTITGKTAKDTVTFSIPNVKAK